MQDSALFSTARVGLKQEELVCLILMLSDAKPAIRVALT